MPTAPRRCSLRRSRSARRRRRFASPRRATAHAPSPDAVTRLLRRLDEARVRASSSSPARHVDPAEPAIAARAGDGAARRSVADGARGAAARLERPLRRAPVRVERLHRARSHAVLADQPATRRRCALALRFRRRDAPATARPRDGRAAASPAATTWGFMASVEVLRVLSDTARRDPGPDVARRGHERLMADPVSWLLIEPGWRVDGRGRHGARPHRGGAPATRIETSSTASRSPAAPSARPRYVARGAGRRRSSRARSR